MKTNVYKFIALNLVHAESDNKLSFIKYFLVKRFLLGGLIHASDSNLLNRFNRICSMTLSVTPVGGDEQRFINESFESFT